MVQTFHLFRGHMAQRDTTKAGQKLNTGRKKVSAKNSQSETALLTFSCTVIPNTHLVYSLVANRVGSTDARTWRLAG
jgi:hypothetical protein